MKKIISIILIILALGLIFVGCDNVITPPDETTATTPETTETTPSESETTPIETEPTPPEELESIKLFNNGVSMYSIVCSDSISAELEEEIKNLNKAILTKAGKSLELKDDFINEALGIVESPYEIVIGDCNRSVVKEVKASLRTNDNIIKVIGTKIVVVGGDEENTIKAVATFRRKCITGNDTEGLEIAGDFVFRFDGEYDINELKLNGNNISDYVIVYENSSYLTAAARFNDKLKAIAGVSLDIKQALNASGNAHGIMFGNCKSGISDGVKADNGSYKLLSDGNDICIVAASAMQADDAVIDIIEKYFPTGKQETFDISIASGTAEISLKLGETLKVLTQNLWETGYAEDVTKQIISRNEYLVEIFEQKRPDIICFQEASRDRNNPNNKGKSIYDYVYGDLKQFYNVVCEKRNDDKRGSFTPIFYRADLYNVIESECYRFNDRFDDSDNKSLSWVVFENKITGKKFGIINCHFALFMDKYNDENRGESETKYGYTGQSDGGLGETWRQGNVQQVIERYTTMRASYGADLPVIMTGDFNANPDKVSYQMLANYKDFADSRLVSTGASTQGKSSWHNHGVLPKDGTSMLLDHLFVTKDVITVLSHEIIINSRSIKASDHCAVVCEYQFK